MSSYKKALKKSFKRLLAKELATYCDENNISLSELSEKIGMCEGTLRRIYDTGNLQWRDFATILGGLNKWISISLIDWPVAQISDDNDEE